MNVSFVQEREVAFYCQNSFSNLMVQWIAECDRLNDQSYCFSRFGSRLWRGILALAACSTVNLLVS